MTSRPMLAPLREVITTYGLDARKALGQHFLLDQNITDKIVRISGAGSADAVLEIGPGPGGLTRSLLRTGAHVTVIERDERCIGILEDLREHYPGQLTIQMEDALACDEFRMLNGGPARIVSNLPYNISTELLVKWLHAGADLWTSMTLMFQREVADRILAQPGSKIYGRLSVISQAASTPQKGFDLPARAFTPPPKVDSSVVHFEPPSINPKSIRTLETITQAAFSQRRKMVRSSLKSVLGPSLDDTLERCEILPTMRAEEISVPQYQRLATLLMDRPRET